MQFMGMGFLADGRSLDFTATYTDTITAVTASNGIYDSLEAHNRFIDDWNGKSEYEWDDETTAFSCLFRGTAMAGNLASGLDEFDSIRIKRRKKGDLVFQTMYSATVDPDEGFTFQIIDYSAGIGEYEYALVPVLNGVEMGMAIDSVVSDFDGIFIVEPDRSYPMYLEAEFEHNRTRAGSTVSTLGSKYPFYVSNGLANYVVGSASGLFVQETLDKCGWDYENGWKYRENVNEFLTNGRPKIIKADTGEIYMCVIQTDSISESGEYRFPITSFNWQQCGDVDDMNDLYKCGFVNAYNESLFVQAYIS